MLLNKIHGRAQGLAVKIFLGILGASFGLWGIADVIQKYWSNRPIARIGKHDVSYEELSHALNQETSRIQEMYKGKLDPKILRKLELHKLVLERLINQKALTQLLLNMNFAASDTFVGEIVRQQPVFKKDGAYDSQLLREILRSNGLSETKFLEQIREDIYKQQLVGTLASSTRLPKVLVDIITDELTMKHTFASITIPFDTIQLDKQASEDDLKLMFEQKKELYKIPEYRTAQVVVFDQNILSKEIALTENEVNERYANSINEFTRPERRIIRKINYPNQATALAASEHLKKGRPMTAVVRDVPGGKFDDIGLIEKADIPENLQKTIFSLEVGKPSDPIETGTTYSIYEVTKIEKSVIEPLSAVRGKIEEDLRIQKYADFFQELRNAFEDELAAGIKLADAAKKHNLIVINLLPFNQEGTSSEGKDALEPLNRKIREAVLEQVFMLDAGKDSMITDVSATLSFVVHVEKITPAIIPEFASIKEKVNKDWVRTQKREAAHKLAQKCIKDENELKAHAHKHHLSYSADHTIRRVDLELPEFKKSQENKFFSLLPSKLTEKLFTLTIEKPAYDELPNDSIIILKLKKMDADKMDEPTKKKIRDSLQQMTQQDIVPILTMTARDRVDYELNEKLFKMATQAFNDAD
ncbi:MAG: SurA N-terminal domain-containing protein [Candidatus Paracaedibacteraceae bacterium]|nr:SurA N-terminal domain-containing protein [Candidatus Paracaedibacteraceae bacterium]